MGRGNGGVILEVVAVDGEDGDGIFGVLRQLDRALYAAALRRRDVTNDVFGDRVVEVGVPAWAC